MGDNKLNELLNSFNIQVDTVKNRLTDMLVKVSDGRVPNTEELQLFHSDIDTLLNEYDQLKGEAESVLSVDELPKEGSRAIDYVEAVNNSRIHRIKNQLKNAESVLKRFLKVRSLITEYENVLLPFKDKAAEVLRVLSEDNIDQILPETVGPEIFLKALETENINSTDGFKILEEINNYYPIQVQWGLVGKQYYIDEEQGIELKNDDEEVPLTNITENIVDAYIEDGDISDSEFTTEKETKEVTCEEQSVEINKQHADSEPRNESTEEEPLVEDQEEMLVATNKVKSGASSASSFKNEIVKLGKINKEVRDILPLMTNLGVLTKEQIYLIGICMDCFEESDRDREKVDSAIEVLANKGYLARFDYDKDGMEKEAFCLSTYCYGCLLKNTIYTSGQMRGFWTLSFGDVQIHTSSDIEKSVVDKFIRNNDKLAEYLYAVKGLVEPDEYKKILQSIKWKKDYYRIAVVKDGETTNCCLYDPEGFLEEVKEDGVLAIGCEIADTFTGENKKIFIYDNQSITILGERLNAAEDETDKELNCESETSEEHMSAASKESEVITSPMETGIDNAVKNEVFSVEEDSYPEEVSAKSLLNKNTIPKDEEFCTVMKRLLNREATTKENLTSVISQTIAFAKAVSDIATKDDGILKDYEESYKLSAQLRLASNLMLNECVYTSEFLSSVFISPENEDPALMLSAYMFAMLIPGMAFDYDMNNQTKVFLDYYEDYFNDFAAFKPLFNKLMAVKDAAATGFSPVFVSLLGDEAENEKFINVLITSARECLTVKAPKTRMKALPPMYSACFGQGSELHDCMTIISENRQGKDEIEYVELVLREYCDELNGTLNLSSTKIENALSNAWYDVNPKNKFKLEYDARDQALRQFTVRLEIMQK